MKVGVIGAGTMGSGIAQVFAENGHEVLLSDIKLEFAENGKAKVKKGLDRLVSKEKIEQDKADEIVNRITPCGNDDLSDCDLIVEAAIEDYDIKKETFRKLDEQVKEGCLFASNTSSISITKIAEGLKHDFVGFHFFNPAPVMKLIEVTEGLNTPPEVVDRAMEIAESLGKTPVKVQDNAGFVVNRVLIPMINEAIGLYAEGIASAEDIDTAMKLGCNHPMGPLALGDLIGLDVCLAIMEVLYQDTGDSKYRAHPYLRKMVRGKNLGRKSGKGFFDYSK